MKLISAVFFFMTALYFPAMEVYMRNYEEFECPLKYVWWIYLAFTVICILFLTVILVLLPEKISRVLTYIVFGCGVCTYIQSLFLNGQLSTMQGGTMAFSMLTVVINVVIWTSIIIITVIVGVIAEKRCGKDKLVKFISGMAYAMLFIQSVGLFSNALTVEKKDVGTDYYLTNEGEYELSEGDNVICFIIDSCGTDYVTKALREDPEIFASFSDFIYYPDSTCRYCPTYPSVLYLLTAIDGYDLSEPENKVVETAYECSDFLFKMHENKTNIGVYTHNSLIPNSYDAPIDNCEVYYTGGFNSFSTINLIKAMLHLSGYRSSPYILKYIFNYTGDSFNNGVMYRPDNYAIQYDDYSFLCGIDEIGMSVTKEYDSAFRFYHLFGTHLGCSLGTDGLPSSNFTTPSEALHGSLKIIDRYISEVKELGVYDNSTIIIMADHGYDSAGILFMVKPPEKIMNTKGKALISKSDISHKDYFATVYAGLGMECNDYGKAVWDITERREEPRYFTLLYEVINGGENVSEYVIIGDVNEASNIVRIN